MLDDTLLSNIVIRVVIFILQWLGPCFLGYTAYFISSAWPKTPLITGFRIWCTAESLFFLFSLWFRRYLQRDAVHPPLKSQKQRKALFAKVRREIHDPDLFLSGWFRGAKPETIGREDLRSFLNWAFWDGRAGASDQKELEYYMNKVEAMMRKPFAPPGHGAAKGLRLTLDPVEMECRTLFWYCLVSMKSDWSDECVTDTYAVRLDLQTPLHISGCAAAVFNTSKLQPRASRSSRSAQLHG